VRALIVALVLVTVGCKGDDPKKGPAPQDDLVKGPKGGGLEEPEVKRGIEICDRYMQRVCGCAKNDPSLEGDCAMAQAMPEALRMQLRAAIGDDGLDGGPPSTYERQSLEAQARKTVNGCMRSDGALDPKKCPR
jgi:hypothetical protein